VELDPPAHGGEGSEEAKGALGARLLRDDPEAAEDPDEVRIDGAEVRAAGEHQRDGGGLHADPVGAREIRDGGIDVDARAP